MYAMGMNPVAEIGVKNYDTKNIIKKIDKQK